MGTFRNWRPTVLVAAAATVLAAVASSIVFSPAHVEAAALAPGWTTGGRPATTSIREAEWGGRTPAAAAMAALDDEPGYLTPTSRGWLDKKLRSFGRKLKGAFKRVGSNFRRSVKKLSEAVRDVGRAMKKAVGDAGKAIRKASDGVKRFVEKRARKIRDLGRNIKKVVGRGLEGLRDDLRCIRRSSKCSHFVKSNAQAIAEAEADATKVLAILDSDISSATTFLQQQTARVQEQTKGLGELLQTIPPPLNNYAKTAIYPGPFEAGQGELATSVLLQESIAANVTAGAEEMVKVLDDGAIAAPSSKKLLAIAQSGQRLLLKLTMAVNTLTEEMQKLRKVLEKIESAMS